MHCSDIKLCTFCKTSHHVFNPSGLVLWFKEEGFREFVNAVNRTNRKDSRNVS